ncbi:hypothetical protein LOC59_02255 [Arthrobacter sp. zg-Y916]|uniref:hypothetical protein n=1 Tax=Arthrobacter sp. zg-Y916 TaxID=2894190 RepID=UPI001E4C7950|nr:hypothetical protein [Arthrobacter sp. zg-Y916]MCC9192477.1 hypothetical protein [Arthrobacter sp. zg-Y916]
MDTAQVRLWWLPVGAGGHLVVHTSRWWELWRALRERRRPRPLFHAALEVTASGSRYAIEMTPAWGQGTGPLGVVATGPVGLRSLGRLRLFRYEVRCWPNGVIPDLAFAPEPALVFNLDAAGAEALLARVPQVPLKVWGAKVPGGDMWNSNSLVSWLLQTSGFDAAALQPPQGGRAPGWLAGIDAARPQSPTAEAEQRP